MSFTKTPITFYNRYTIAWLNECRDNPNPVTRCGHIFNALNYNYRVYEHFTAHPVSLYDLLNEIYGDFYQIDPLSIFTVEDPIVYGIKVGFKAKSKIKPYLQELEDWRVECLEYWIENLQAS